MHKKGKEYNDTLKSTIVRLEHEKKGLEEAKTQIEIEKNNIENKINELIEEKKGLAIRVEQLEIENKKINEENKKINEEKEEIQIELGKKEKSYVKLEKRASDALYKKDAIIEEKDKNIAELTGEINKYKNKIINLNEDIAGLQRARGSTQQMGAELQRLLEENKVLTQKIEEEKQSAEHMKAEQSRNAMMEIAEIERERDTRENELMNMVREIKNQHSDALQKIQTLDNYVTQLTSANEGMKKEMEDKINNINNELEKERALLQEKSAGYDTLLRERKETAARHTQEIAQLENKHNEEVEKLRIQMREEVEKVGMIITDRENALKRTSAQVRIVIYI